MAACKTMRGVVVLVLALLAVLVSIAAAQGGTRYDLARPPRCTTKAQKKAFKRAAKAGNGEGTRLCVCVRVCITYCACVVASCMLYESYMCE